MKKIKIGSVIGGLYTVCMPAASVWQDQLHRMENMQYGILTAMAEAFGVAHTFPAGKRRNNSMQTGVSHR